MVKAAIYARVSTQEQHLEQQVEPCVKYCQASGMEYAVYGEKISGAKASRPQLDLMLQGIRAGRYGAVVVLKLDRLGRSTIHLVQLIEEFKKKGVQFVAVTQGIDTSTPQGMFFFTILAAVAELEREFIRERTQKRLDYLRRNGRRLGRPKGAKDKTPRRKGGYIQRWMGTKQQNPYGYSPPKILPPTIY